VKRSEERQPRKRKSLAAKQMRTTKPLSKANETSERRYGSKKCANKKSSRTNKSVSRRRNKERSVNWSDKGKRKRGPGGKRSMTNDEPSVSACARNKGHSTSNEIESERSDTNEEDERIEIGIATGIVTATATVLPHIGPIVDYPLVVAIRNERNPPRPKTRPLRHYSQLWMKSHWKRLR
jgi:hypothetical protein